MAINISPIVNSIPTYLEKVNVEVTTLYFDSRLKRDPGRIYQHIKKNI